MPRARLAYDFALHRFCPQLEALEARLMLDGQGFGFDVPAYDVGTAPLAIVSADFNGDGHADVVTASNDSGTVSLLRNLGDGTFAAQVTYAVGSEPRSVHVADFDADGHLDLVVANSGSDTVSILRNQGDGTFAAQVTYAVGSQPRVVVAADVDGDGHADIATVNRTSGDVSVLRNQGDGTFADGVNYAAGGSPFSIVAGDFDGDGHLDLVAANSGDLLLLRNQGDGTFAAQVAYDLESTASSLSAADFDGDGRMDLVITDDPVDSDIRSRVSVLRNQGDGTFANLVNYGVQLYPDFVMTTDIDGDGYTDIVVLSYNWFSIYSDGPPAPVSVDVYDGEVSILRNQQNGTFADPVSYGTVNDIRSVTAGDFDGDGHVDLATGQRSQAGATVSVLRNRGNGTLAARMIAEHGGSGWSFTTGDFDGDGYLDLATPIHNAVAIQYGQGDGTFARQQIYQTPGLPIDLKAADFDNDGRLDLVYVNDPGQNPFDGSIFVMRNLGNGTFASGVSYLTGTTPLEIVTADLNGDNYPDLVVSVRNGISVHWNDGEGGFSSGYFYLFPGSGGEITAGDFDGDGDIDVISSNNDSSLSMFRNSGSALDPYSTIPLTTTNSFGGFTFADLNQDGRLDLIVAGEGVEGVTVLLNQGNDTFGTEISYGEGFYPYSVAAADFNADGQLDLVTTNYWSNTISILAGLGDGTFAPQVEYAAGRYPHGVTPGDFDGDGHLDLAAINLSAQTGFSTVSVFLNRRRQLEDVDDNQRIEIVDALLLIHELLTNGQRGLNEPATSGPYFDVDNNGRVEVLDAILVINALVNGARAAPSTREVPDIAANSTQGSGFSAIRSNLESEAFQDWDVLAVSTAMDETARKVRATDAVFLAVADDI